MSFCKSRWRLACFAAAQGCLPEFEKVHGPHILYEHSAVLDPCAGTATYVDSIVPFLERRLNVTAQGPLRYSWLTEQDVPWGLVEGEGGKLAGQAVGQHAWSTAPVQAHEVAHLVMGMNSATFFVEGIAVAMDLTGQLGARYVPADKVDEFLYDPRPTMTATLSRDVDYAAAGFFVTFLLVRHGPERFRKFYAALHWPFTMERISDAFLKIYGVELDSEVEEYMQGIPACEEGHFDLQPLQCLGPIIPWDGRDWVFSESMDCEAPGVVGGLGPDNSWPSFRAVTLDVSTAGAYGLVTKGDPGILFRFGPCFGCPWDLRDVRSQVGEIKSLWLTPGQYYLGIDSRSDFSADAEVILTPL